MSTQRNRDYSSPPEGIKNVSALYGWNSTLQITGATNPQTGAWSSVNVSPNGNLTTESASSLTASDLSIGVLGGTGFFTGYFPANENRIEAFAQNVATVTATYVKFGTLASRQSYNYVLNPASTSGLGGGTFSNETFKGAIYFSGGAVVGYSV